MKIIDQPQLITYDGSLEGFFTVIFEIYLHEYPVEKIVKVNQYKPDLFSEPIFIETDLPKAERVLRKVAEKVGKPTMKSILATFLAEKEAPEMQLFEFVKKVLSNQLADKDYRDDHMLAVHQIAQKVKMEAHRFKGFIRFKLSLDGVYTATIEPDHDILPLLSRHFKNRYADQQWIIFDLKRQKGLFYLNGQVELLTSENHVAGLAREDLHEDEIIFQDMWKEYFKHVNITERKNLRLQRQHMPSRYWKYLLEMDH